VENLGLARPGGSREANLDRLRAAAEVCYECSPGGPAIVETTVGNRPDTWDGLRSAMADELAAWAKKAEQLRPFGVDMRKTMEQIVPRTVFVHIKDTLGTAPNHRFVLPGDGPVDFKAYAKNLVELGYRGAVVSVDVLDQPGCHPVKAAEHVWQKVSRAFA
jgi:hypothetical protein